MPITPFLTNTSFDPETVDTLSAAFEEAWKRVRQSGSTLSRPAYERGTREVLARCIIEMAQHGERDQRRLSEAAVLYLANNYKE